MKDLFSEPKTQTKTVIVTGLSQTVKELFETTTNFLSSNYALFYFFNFNRPVNKNHVKVLADSMKRWGFQGCITVIKTSAIDGIMRYYVLDGQHRLSAAKLLGIPIEFKIVEIETKLELAQFISDVNNSAKGWGTNQFLNVWAQLEIREYVKMLRIQQETNIQITPLVKAYSGKGSMKDFRSGTMVFIDEAKSDKIIEQIVDLDGYLPKKAFCRRAIIEIMNNKNYDHKKMKPLIIRQAVTRTFSENEVDLKEELTTILRASTRRTK